MQLPELTPEQRFARYQQGKKLLQRLEALSSELDDMKVKHEFIIDMKALLGE